MIIRADVNPVPKKYVPLYKLCMNVAGVVIGAFWLMAALAIIGFIIKE